jgi:hypothetical protein
MLTSILVKHMGSNCDSICRFECGGLPTPSRSLMRASLCPQRCISVAIDVSHLVQPAEKDLLPYSRVSSDKWLQE